MMTLIQIVGKSSATLHTKNDLIGLDLIDDKESARSTAHLRPELQNEPCLKGLCGPMWDGWRDEDGESVYPVNDKDPHGPRQPYCRTTKPIAAKILRYETWEAYESYSR